MPLQRLAFQPEARSPLRGIRVLDFARLAAGNMLSLQLADFGAEVVKVEEPRHGDTLRNWKTEGHSLHWKVYARNKKSITLDLKLPQARALVLRLLPQFDVMCESFRHKELERMGLGWDILSAVNPKLILVRISGFGQTGPYAPRPGFGTLIEAMSGFASLNGFADREPLLPPLALADMIAGMAGAVAVQAAIREVEQHGGRGQVVDVNLLEAMVSVLAVESAWHRTTGRIKTRTGNASAAAAPRNVYRTSDGAWLALSSSTEAMTRRVWTCVGRPELNDDLRFNTNAARVRNRDDVDRIIGDWVGARTLAEALNRFESTGVTAAPVYDMRQFLEDPHVQQRGVMVEIDDEDMGSLPVHQPGPRLSETPPAIRSRAPRLGEHNVEIWRRAGLSATELAAMREGGVI